MERDEANLQNEFFNAIRKNRTVVAVYLANGKRLVGRIRSFDRFTLLLDGGHGEQMIFKHAISTVCTVRNPAVLAGIASEVGMNPAEVLRALQDGTDEDAVRSLVEQARQAGISGLPFFIINGEHALSGAQPPDAFRIP